MTTKEFDSPASTALSCLFSILSYSILSCPVLSCALLSSSIQCPQFSKRGLSWNKTKLSLPALLCCFSLIVLPSIHYMHFISLKHRPKETTTPAKQQQFRQRRPNSYDIFASHISRTIWHSWFNLNDKDSSRFVY